MLFLHLLPLHTKLSATLAKVCALRARSPDTPARALQPAHPGRATWQGSGAGSVEVALTEKGAAQDFLQFPVPLTRSSPSSSSHSHLAKNSSLTSFQSWFRAVHFLILLGSYKNLYLFLPSNILNYLLGLAFLFPHELKLSIAHLLCPRCRDKSEGNPALKERVVW